MFRASALFLAGVVATVAGNTFTLRAANGATLRGTVLAPASVTIATRAATLGHEATCDGHHVTRDFARTILDVPAAPVEPRSGAPSGLL